MRSHLLLVPVLLMCTLTIEISANVPLDENKDLFGNGDGWPSKMLGGPTSMEKDEFNKMFHRDLKEANLTKLLEWLEFTHDMKDYLVKMENDAKENNEVFYEGVIVPGRREEILQRIQNAMKFLDGNISQLEKELRAPNKSWNYSKDVIVFNPSIKAYSGNVDDYDEEISMRQYLPFYRPLSPNEEQNITTQLEEHIKTGNLSTLLQLMKWTSGLQDELSELKTNVTEKGVRDFYGKIKFHAPPEHIVASINDTIDFLKRYENKIENELRKPSKSWNYPAKENN